MNDKIQRSMPLQLIVVMGLPGSGKSAAARLIAQRFNAVLLRSDVIRKELFPAPSYTSEEGRRVYREVYERAAKLLDSGTLVVLDATFRTGVQRRQAIQIAEEHGAAWRLVLVTAPEDLIRARLAVRRNDPSDATYETYQQLQSEWEAVKEPHEVIDNKGTLADLFYQVAALPLR